MRFFETITDNMIILFVIVNKIDSMLDYGEYIIECGKTIQRRRKKYSKPSRG
jgi:hypothetical protein